jgi:hypothetical protein
MLTQMLPGPTMGMVGLAGGGRGTGLDETSVRAVLVAVGALGMLVSGADEVGTLCGAEGGVPGLRCSPERSLLAAVVAAFVRALLGARPVSVSSSSGRARRAGVEAGEDGVFGSGTSAGVVDVCVGPWTDDVAVAAAGIGTDDADAEVLAPNAPAFRAAFCFSISLAAAPLTTGRRRIFMTDAGVACGVAEAGGDA